MAQPIGEERVVAKVGGRFRLTALVQKRLRELTAGAQKLVDTDATDFLQVIYQEILEEKIDAGPPEAEVDEATVRAALEVEE